MKQKIRVGVLFGGMSAEHEVSLQSAKNIIEAIDTEHYDITSIKITKDGHWELAGIKVALASQSQGRITSLVTGEIVQIVDVVFPMLHGPCGEDGTVQGLLQLAQVPFVGAGVLGSAIGMDKDVMKRLLREAGIPTATYVVAKHKNEVDFTDIENKLGLPVFIKPANMGSSVGVSKVTNKIEFDMAVNEAFKYDTKILIEEMVIGREIECSVLGNTNPVASSLGEITPNHSFYSYEAKYLDENGAGLSIPANVSDEEKTAIQQMAIKVYTTLECEGLGRVDFFLKPNGELSVIEINTIPGFTKISMYPKLWEHSGVSYTQLISKLIDLAIERFERQGMLQTSFVINSIK